MNLRIREFRNLKDIELPLEGVVQVVGEPGCGRTNLERAFTWLVCGGDEPGYVSLGDIARRTEKGLEVSGAASGRTVIHLLEAHLGMRSIYDGMAVSWPYVRDVGDFCEWYHAEAWTDRLKAAAPGDLEAELLENMLHDDAEPATLGGRLQLKIDDLKRQIDRVITKVRTTSLPPTDEQIQAQEARVAKASNDVDRSIAINALGALKQAQVDSGGLDLLKAERSRLERRLVASQRLLAAVDSVPSDGHEERELWKLVLKDAGEMVGHSFSRSMSGEPQVDGRPLATLSSTEKALWDLVVKAHCLASINFPYLFLDCSQYVPGMLHFINRLRRSFKAVVWMFPTVEAFSATDTTVYYLVSGRLTSHSQVHSHA
jgi:hypothetical protein